MREVRKKVLAKYFSKILSGEKKVELRLADWEIENGDILLLEEIDDETREKTGRTIATKVTYVLKTKSCTFWSKEEIDEHGFQIIQFDKLSEGEKNE